MIYQTNHLAQTVWSELDINISMEAVYKGLCYLYDENFRFVQIENKK